MQSQDWLSTAITHNLIVILDSLGEERWRQMFKATNNHALVDWVRSKRIMEGYSRILHEKPSRASCGNSQESRIRTAVDAVGYGRKIVRH